MTETHTGGCHCGRLRYAFAAPLQDIAHCHCAICRRTTGGIVTTWLTLPLASFRWTQGSAAAYASSTSCLRCLLPSARTAWTSPWPASITPSRRRPIGISG